MEEIFVGMLAFFAFFAIIGLVLYLVLAFGLYRMAANQNIELAWLSFVPIAQFYIMGLLIGDRVVLFDREITNVGMILVVGSIVAPMLNVIPVIGTLIFLAFIVFQYYIIYKLFESYGDNPVLHLVLSIIVPVLFPVFIFMLRENESKVRLA